MANNKSVNNGHLLCLWPSQDFLKMWGITKNATMFRLDSLKSFCWWLLRVICHCLLWRAFNWGEWCCIFMVKFNCLLRNLFVSIFLFCYTKLWKCMCLLPLFNMQLWQQNLTCGEGQPWSRHVRQNIKETCFVSKVILFN